MSSRCRSNSPWLVRAARGARRIHLIRRAVIARMGQTFRSQGFLPGTPSSSSKGSNINDKYCNLYQGENLWRRKSTGKRIKDRREAPKRLGFLIRALHAELLLTRAGSEGPILAPSSAATSGRRVGFRGYIRLQVLFVSSRRSMGFETKAVDCGVSDPGVLSRAFR